LRRIVPALALSALVFTALPTAAAPKLQTFGTGEVSISGGTVTIVNGIAGYDENDDPIPEYGGVYLKPRSQSAKLTSVAFSFTNLDDVAGGAPRFSIPIDDRDPSTNDTYAFIDVNSCGGDSLVSTTNPDCMVYFWTESAPYDNWADFAAEHPTWRVAPSVPPFIIADWFGEYRVTDIVLR
jgi:hypothetical protein